MTPSLEDLKSSLKRELSSDPYRYFHSLLVLEISSDLVEYHSNISLHKIQIAALMHDFSKNVSIQEARVFAEKFQEPFLDDFSQFPTLTHGYLSSLKLKHQFHIQDAEILEAVSFHTTGKANWSQTGILLYIADFLSSTHQTNPNLFLPLYKTAQNSLHQAAFDICTTKIEYLQQHNLHIHYWTIDFQKWLRSFLYLQQ